MEGCDAEKTLTDVAIDENNHTNIAEIDETDSICIAHGYTAGTYCNDCHNWLTGHDEKPLAEHTWDDGEITTPATCSVMGFTTYRCTTEGCTAEKTVQDVAIDPNNHVNKTNVAETDSTCVKHGYTVGVYCEDCVSWLSGHEEKPFADHVWNGGAVSKPATCVSMGETTYACTVEGCNETKTLTDIPVNPSNHAGPIETRGCVAPTEDEDGYSGDKYCAACDTLLEAGHSLRHTRGACVYCGGCHEGVWGSVVTAVHGILWLLRRFFRIG